MIDKSTEENKQDRNISQGENKEVVKYDKSKKYSDWSNKTMQTYKVKRKLKRKL